MAEPKRSIASRALRTDPSSHRTASLVVTSWSPRFAIASSLNARHALAIAVAADSIAKPPNVELLRTKDRLLIFEFAPYAGPRGSW
jgi:hypothetical protein